MGIFPNVYDVVDVVMMLAIVAPSAYVAGIVRERYRKHRRYELPRW